MEQKFSAELNCLLLVSLCMCGNAGGWQEMPQHRFQDINKITKPNGTHSCLGVLVGTTMHWQQVTALMK